MQARCCFACHSIARRRLAPVHSQGRGSGKSTLSGGQRHSAKVSHGLPSIRQRSVPAHPARKTTDVFPPPAQHRFANRVRSAGGSGPGLCRCSSPEVLAAWLSSVRAFGRDGSAFGSGRLGIAVVEARPAATPPGQMARRSYPGDSASGARLLLSPHEGAEREVSGANWAT